MLRGRHHLGRLVAFELGASDGGLARDPAHAVTLGEAPRLRRALCVRPRSLRDRHDGEPQPRDPPVPMRSATQFPTHRPGRSPRQAHRRPPRACLPAVPDARCATRRSDRKRLLEPATSRRSQRLKQATQSLTRGTIAAERRGLREHAKCGRQVDVGSAYERKVFDELAAETGAGPCRSRRCTPRGPSRWPI